MKIQNREKPFWAWRTRPFKLVRVTETSVKNGVTIDFIATSSGYGDLIPLQPSTYILPYSTFSSKYMCITEAHISIKRKLLKTIFDKIDYKR